MAEAEHAANYRRSLVDQYGPAGFPDTCRQTNSGYWTVPCAGAPEDLKECLKPGGSVGTGGGGTEAGGLAEAIASRWRSLLDWIEKSSNL